MLRSVRFAHDAGGIFQRANLRRDTAAAVLALADPWNVAVEPIRRERFFASLEATRREQAGSMS